METSRKTLPCPCCANLNKRPKQNTWYLVKKIECFVHNTRFKCRIPRGRLPPSVCLSVAVSTAAQQDWPSTRFNTKPSKCRPLQERGRQQGCKLQELRPCATSGTKTKQKKKVSSKNYSLRTREQERERATNNVRVSAL